MASIEKRTRDGRNVWRAHYRTPAGKQRNKSFSRKVDAERFLARRYLTHAQVDALAYACGYPAEVSKHRAVIAESVTPVQGMGMVWGTTKTHQRREVPIPRFLVHDLAKHLDGREPDDLVFAGIRSGSPLRVSL